MKIERKKPAEGIEKGQKVKRSKVTFDLLQYEQKEDDIPKGLMRNAIINNKPLYNVRARTIIIIIIIITRTIIIIIYRIFYHHHKLYSLTEELAANLSSRLPLEKGKSPKVTFDLLTF